MQVQNDMPAKLDTRTIVSLRLKESEYLLNSEGIYPSLRVKYVLRNPSSVSISSTVEKEATITASLTAIKRWSILVNGMIFSTRISCKSKYILLEISSFEHLQNAKIDHLVFISLRRHL